MSLALTSMPRPWTVAVADRGDDTVRAVAVVDDDDEPARDTRAGGRDGRLDRELEELLRRDRVDLHVAAGPDVHAVADRGLHVLVDDVDDDPDADARVAFGERDRAGDVDQMRVVGRGDGDRLARAAVRAAVQRIVHVDAGREVRLGVDREDVDDDRAGDGRVAAAGRAAERDRRDRREA